MDDQIEGKATQLKTTTVKIFLGDYYGEKSLQSQSSKTGMALEDFF